MNFPLNPTIGQEYTFNSRKWSFNGFGWAKIIVADAPSESTPTFSPRNIIFTNNTGNLISTNGYSLPVFVYKNGVRLSPSNFTATDGINVELTTALTVEDTIELSWFENLNGSIVSESPTNLQIGTTNINITIENDSGTGVVLPSASNTNAGLLTSTDKVKLDGISSGANVIGTGMSAIVVLTQEEYDNLGVKNPSTIYATYEPE